MSDKGISVIMPSLNVVDCIEECMESIVNQTFKDLDIICIDAGSTDGTWEILKAFAERDDRIRLFQSDVRSYGAQVNQGIRVARGKYIAILETDDYVNKDMYGSLYELAEREHVDYVKADYKSFYTLKNGSRIYTTIRLFEKNSELYNKVFCPHELNILYQSDVNLWKGIYRKAFLIDNQIVLNETGGAAYQDIGFMGQVLAYAKTAYYSDKLLYFYRVNREGASSGSINAVKYVWTEFSALKGRFLRSVEKVYKKGFYICMIGWFCCEYGKILEKVNFDCDAPACAAYYPWFKEEIEEALTKGLISKADFEEKYFDRFMLLLKSPKEFSAMLKKENDERQKCFESLNATGERPIVIFGSGFWGCEVLKFLDKTDGNRPVAFADNAKEKAGTSIADIPVYGLAECLKLFPEANYIIANEKYSHEMKKQYLNEGGKKENLVCLFEKKQVFWGTGKIGRMVLEFWKRLDMGPDFFCDNEKKRWGMEIDGVKILAPAEVYDLKGKVTVFITCGQYPEIKKQLLEHGMPEEDIVISDGISAQEMIYRLSDILYKSFFHKAHMENGMYQCLIDLSCGMVLGGVERWSYSLAETLNGLGISSAYIMPGGCTKDVADNGIPELSVKSRVGIPIIDTVKSILETGPHTVICNFPFDIMMGACMIKRYVNPKLRVIAVLHNDEEIYYRTLMTWEKYIDVCLTISTKIKNTLLNRGFASHKLKDLYWRIPLSGECKRQYSAGEMPLKIGYAGRISTTQKRIDLLLEAGERLKKNRVNFCLNIAGSGDYEGELRKQITEKGLDNEIHMLGVVDHEQIMEFWQEQDICISCSEWEGHSISHSEAMAAGAVLVITDTSGARDDVEEGKNGFVVNVGDTEQLVNKIIYLYEHRELLPQMGSYSIRKIRERNKYMDPNHYWRSLLD